MKIEHNIPLAPLSTFNIGGNARYFAEATSLEDLKAAVAYGRGLNVPIFILGGGSNILVSDEGFPGIVIRPNIKGITCNVLKDSGECIAHAGDMWDDVVEASVKKRFSGLENLSLIPGTLGGAVVQNIGAYGAELKDTLLWVDMFDMITGEVVRFKKVDCNFAYRTSFFKTSRGRRYIIVKAAFSFKKGVKPDISYKDLAAYFPYREHKHPTIRQVREAVIGIRLAKLPDLKKYGTAGSFFKNPIITVRLFREIEKVYPDMPTFPVNDTTVKISAAWIIDKVCGLKGYREGDAGVFERQALVLVNHGKATASEIENLADKITQAVFDATGINLEREVESV